MIKLTKTNGKLVYIVPENVTDVSEQENGETLICQTDGYTTVTDSIEEVVRKIMEYKLAMVRVTSLAQAWADNSDPRSESFAITDNSLDVWESKIDELAGLEASPDAK